MKKIFILLVIMFSLVAVMPAQAQLGKALSNLTKSAQGTGLEKQGDLATTIGTIIKAVLALTGTIFLILTIYAGILWMTAAGNDERIKKATSIITTAVVGLIIVMAAYAITYFVTTRLGGTSGSTGSGGSVTGCCISPDAQNNYSSTQAGCTSVNYYWSATPCNQ